MVYHKFINHRVSLMLEFTVWTKRTISLLLIGSLLKGANLNSLMIKLKKRINCSNKGLN